MARQQPPERGPVALNDVVAAALDITGYAVRTSSIEVDARSRATTFRRSWPTPTSCTRCCSTSSSTRSSRCRTSRRRAASASTSALRRARATRCASPSPTTARAFPPHLRARVFEPYFTTKPTGVGLGVGLAVSLGIVEAHGGTLTVECPREGGAVFTVTLPVGAIDAPRGGRARRRRRRATAQRAILIVDDEPEIRDTLAEILAGARHRVVDGGSGREALRADGRRALRRDPHRHPHARPRRSRALPGDRAALARAARRAWSSSPATRSRRRCASSSPRAAGR